MAPDYAAWGWARVGRAGVTPSPDSGLARLFAEDDLPPSFVAHTQAQRLAAMVEPEPSPRFTVGAVTHLAEMSSFPTINEDGTAKDPVTLMLDEISHLAATKGEQWCAAMYRQLNASGMTLDRAAAITARLGRRGK